MLRKRATPEACFTLVDLKLKECIASGFSISHWMAFEKNRNHLYFRDLSF